MDDVAELTNPPTGPLASDLVAEREAVSRSIQSHHPELPPMAMLLGTGVERPRLVKLGRNAAEAPNPYPSPPSHPSATPHASVPAPKGLYAAERG